MLDIEFIRTNSEKVKTAIAQKELALDLDALLRIDESRRKLITARDRLLGERNRLLPEQAKEHGPMLKRELQALAPKIAQIEERFRELMLLVPQIPSPEAPVGDESMNRVVRVEGEPPKLGFEPKDHLTIGRELDLIDTERGAKVGGFRGYYLKNEAVLLHQGLMLLALRLMREHDFTLMVPPTIVREFALVGSGHFPSGRSEIYQVGNITRLEDVNAKERRFLAGTAEPALLSYFAGETFKEQDLPKKVCGVSQCYRSEAGSHGKDTKGLYRLHEFLKVEQVILCGADEAEQEKLFNEMLALAEKMLKLLELPYRVVDIATVEMGVGKTRMHDIETWMPSRQSYGETHSNSALGDWQARRLGIQYLDAKRQKRYVYTLNNTVIASPRILIALLENHQTGDGSIKIPAALREYLGGIDSLRPKNH
ncbi:serine--tRNA ligase [Candidatus Berkelbacteria bacterium]|nr:serine--tRNA ligase [Candidatus Berkelbacteria bacterium]